MQRLFSNNTIDYEIGGNPEKTNYHYIPNYIDWYPGLGFDFQLYFSREPGCNRS